MTYFIGRIGLNLDTASRCVLHPQIPLTVETTELSLPSRIETVAAAAAAVAEFVGRFGVSDDAAFGIDMAVREAVTNAVLHGNRQDENKTVDIVLKSSPDAVEISVHDQGPGFNPEDVPDPTAAENILKTSGRGIFFMRTFMDEVDWLIRPEGGTTVRMLKRR
jgi:serine/threonine-protein kinase RsbW